MTLLTAVTDLRLKPLVKTKITQSHHINWFLWLDPHFHLGDINVPNQSEEYIRTQNLGPDDRLFPVSYSTVRSIIKNLGAQLKISIGEELLITKRAYLANVNAA